MKNPRYVTRALRPGLARFYFYLTKMLFSNRYANDGPLVRALENKLQENWKVKHVICMNNGTTPLVTLLGTLPRGSTVLTTPFSFVATTNAIIATGHNVMFADVEEATGSVDPIKVRRIMEQRQVDCMLFTHVFGFPCDTVELEKIAKEFEIPLFFDAAHTAGISHLGESLVSFGNASSISFHATKLFSTAEGGALITNDDALAKYARNWRNFGYSEGHVSGFGLNGKMSELSAAFGLASLPKLSKEIRRRKSLSAEYALRLGFGAEVFSESPSGIFMPIIFPSEYLLLAAENRLNKEGFFPRRYFSPSLNTLPFLDPNEHEDMPISESISSRILCLPMGSDISNRDVKRICKIIQDENEN